MGIFRLVALFTVIPGASHLSLQAYSHFGVYFYLGSFVAIGIIQIILGIRVWRGDLSNRVFWVATLVNGVATVFWILTRMMYAPFMGGTEHFSVLGVFIGSLQVFFIAFLCWQRKSVRDTIIVIVASIVLGFAAHAGAMLTEKVFPALKGTGSHSHGHDAGIETMDHGDMDMDDGHAGADNSDDHDDADGHHMEEKTNTVNADVVELKTNDHMDDTPDDHPHNEGSDH